MTDDVGFGAPSAFGGQIPTPTMERLAQDGLRFNTFHTTALCSPTRAALITGRNHHSNATGVITEMATGYPGYNSLMSKSSGTIGEILKQNGWNTAWFGKNHNVPDWQSSQAGPFDLWPTGLGFEYSTASSAATRTSGTPRCSMGPTPSRRRTMGNTTWMPTWRTMPLPGSSSSTRLLRTSLSLSTTRRV